ncbi:hypothetical protein B0H14DRAFT_3149103 [Mycena olivaceomarginata]|nr:hypothetical protein B0H14DRAFT_3149103 [Mycena olivaceomarginata]
MPPRRDPGSGASQISGSASSHASKASKALGKVKNAAKKVATTIEKAFDRPQRKRKVALLRLRLLSRTVTRSWLSWEAPLLKVTYIVATLWYKYVASMDCEITTSPHFTPTKVNISYRPKKSSDPPMAAAVALSVLKEGLAAIRKHIGPRQNDLEQRIARSEIYPKYLCTP